MTFHRFASFFLPLFIAVMAVTAAAVAAPQPVTLRVFYSSNLHGEIAPCG
ncbi:MAG: hypothetical protein LBH14_04500 [Desulfobulbaceae bacterium]|jgi:hypothetical protein|nr:hypothetical protein [Desulfobulbaceae bacterium]